MATHGVSMKKSDSGSFCLDFNREAGVRLYFSDYFPGLRPQVQDVTKLSGGLVNHVWKVTFVDEVEIGGSKAKTVVVKHAPPFIASLGPGVPFSQKRLTFEERALKAFSTGIGPLSTIRKENPCVGVPRSLYFDSAQSVLVSEYVGLCPSLQEVLTGKKVGAAEPDPSILTEGDGQLAVRIGAILADFAATLHCETARDKTLKRAFRNDAAAAVVMASVYEPLAEILEHAGIEDAREVTDRAIQRNRPFFEDEYALCHGDFWPGSVLVDYTRPEGGGPGRLKLWIIDWEFCRYEHPAIEVAHFAAWLSMATSYSRGSSMEAPARALLDSFLSEYRTRALSDGGSWVRALAEQQMDVVCGTHMGVDLINEAVSARWCHCSSPPLDGRFCPECTQEMFQTGVEYLRNPQAGIFAALSP